MPETGDSLVNMAPETLLVREVAERLGVDRAEIYRLIRTGILEGHPDDSGDMRVSPGSVDAYLASAASA